MVEPIFDDVLIRSVNVGPVAFTLLALYLIKGLCSFLSTTLVAAAGQRAVTDLRNQLYKHVLNQSFTFLSRHSTGSLMSHVTTDVEKIQNAVSEMAGDVLKEGLTVLGLVVVLFIKDRGSPSCRWWACPRRSTRSSAWAAPRASSETSCGAGGTSRRSSRRRSPGSGSKAFAMEGFEMARFPRRLRSSSSTCGSPARPPSSPHECVGGLAFIAACLRRQCHPHRPAHDGRLHVLRGRAVAMYTPISGCPASTPLSPGGAGRGLPRIFEVPRHPPEIGRTGRRELPG
jgi:hypothetical protein